MWLNAFPFDIIPKNSRVVLYAAGVRGKQIYRFITKTRYCELLLWLDNNADSALVKKPDTIKDLSTDDYDFVLISLYSDAIAKEVAKALVEYGVPENKIVYDIKAYRACASNISFLTFNEFLTSQSNVEKALLKYFYESEGDIDYFCFFIDEVEKFFGSIDEIESRRIKKLIEEKSLDIINGSLPVEAKIVLLYLLIEIKFFTKKLLQELIRLTAEVKDDISLKHWLITDLSGIWYLFPNITYDGFFTDLKDLRHSYAHELNLRWTPPGYCIEENRTICAVVNNLNVSRNSKSVLIYTSPILRIMADMGYKIHVIGLYSFNYDAGMSIVKPFYKIDSQPAVSRDEFIPYFPEDIVIHHVINTTMKNRQQDVLDLISTINPCCIFDFSDEYSSVSYYYSQSYPTIYFPIRKQGHTCSTFFHKHVIIQGSDTAEVHPSITEEQVLRLPLFVTRVEPKREFARTEYGLNDDDIVVITVGNALDYEISKELAEQMCALLRCDQRVRWLIVGCAKHPCINNRHDDLIGDSVLFIDYENDLIGLYGICDVYLNPNRVGGGTTVAWAMQQGLAVISPSTASDGLCYLGKSNALPKEADLVPYIKKLSDNNGLLLSEKKKNRSIAEQWNIESFAAELVRGMNDLIEKKRHVK